MEQLVEGPGGAESETRLLALVRAALTRWRAGVPADRRAATAVPEESMPLFDGLGELDDDQREVLILCELLGQEPERAARLLGCDRPTLGERRDEASTALWRALHGAPPDQPVSPWERLTVGTALRRAAAGWLSPADELVLGYLGEQLFGEAPVGVPAAAPARRPAAAKAPVATAAVAASGAAAGGAEAAGRTEGPPEGAAAEGERGERTGLRRRLAALAGLPRGRWAAWGIAAAAAAGLGVLAALTIGAPVRGSSQCDGGLGCPAPTTLAGASGNAGEVATAPGGRSGHALPTTTTGGLLGPVPRFPPVTARPTSTRPGGRAPTTTRRGTTTSEPPPTTGPGTTAGPTTAPPTTATTTTAAPTPTTTP
jgi:hypothetical protein